MPCMAENSSEEIIAVKRVACIGILVADIIVEPVNGCPQTGLLMPVNSITLHNGGNAMTAAINLKKLGIETEIIGKTGDDVFGVYLKKCMADAGVGVRGLRTTSKEQTSASVLMIDSDGERSFFHCAGANAVFSVKDIDFSVIDECDIVFVTGTFLMNSFDGKETAEFLKMCKQRGKTTFLDVCWDASGKWGEILNMSMPYIDCFMPSINEAVCIAGTDEPEKIADVFIEKGVKNVVIKLGKRGCYIKTASMSSGICVAANAVDAVDTTGAGDSFCSGFIAAYARGENIEMCAGIANTVGRRSVLQKGATSWNADYEELRTEAKGGCKC